MYLPPGQPLRFAFFESLPMQRVLTFAKKLPWAEVRARLRVVGAGMQWLNARLPARYGVWIASMLGVLLSLFTLVGYGVGLLA